MHSRKSYFSARVLAAFIAGLAIVAGVIVVAPAAYAGTDDYPAKWKNAARDSMFDSWGEYNRECTSWVAWRLHGHNSFEMPFHGNADDWGAKAKKLGYTVNKTPAVGSVAWWDTSTRSHVAWVEAVNPNNTVTIEEYNIGGSGRYDETTIATSGPSGYIHFQDLATSFADGAYITYKNNVYRMAGGAPIYVSSWAKFGKTPTGLVTAKQWAALKAVPADGVLIQTATTKKVYEIVGGAPIYVNSWSHVGGVQPVVVVPDASVANAGIGTSAAWHHLNRYPSGTQIVTALPSKLQYQLVNGAPVPVAPAAQTTTASTAAGASDPSPAPTATPTPTSTATPQESSLPVGDDVIANAGTASSGMYAHLLGYIAMPTPVLSGTVKLGHTLKVTLPGWSTKGYRLTYTWYRNGKRTGSASTASSHTFTLKVNAGAQLSVLVTATRANYVTRSVMSAQTVKMAK